MCLLTELRLLFPQFRGHVTGLGRVAGRGRWVEPCRLLDAVAWLLRQPEDAITVQELLDLCRTARR